MKSKPKFILEVVTKVSIYYFNCEGTMLVTHSHLWYCLAAKGHPFIENYHGSKIKQFKSRHPKYPLDIYYYIKSKQ